MSKSKPQSIENLSTRDPGYHVHCKRIRAPGCDSFNERLVLRGVEERDDRRVLLDLVDLSIVLRRCSDLQKNVRLIPYGPAGHECSASLRVAVVCELRLGTGALLDEDTREAFLQQQCCILGS